MTIARALFSVLAFSLTAFPISQTSDPMVIDKCPTENALVQQFNNAAEKWEVIGETYNTTNETFTICYIPSLDKHYEHYHSEENHDQVEEEQQTEGNSCQRIYKMLRSIILSLNLTTEECLEGHGHDDKHNHNITNGTTSSSKTAEVYGYGFLMIVLVSLCSLVGIFLVPLINSNSKVGRQTYEYVYALMIALGISALISDAVLHLIPHSFGLHGDHHGEEGENSNHAGHEHGDTAEEESSSQDYIWKGCLVLLGIYAFYLLEVALHGLGDYLRKKSNGSHEHAHGHHTCDIGDMHYSSEVPVEIKPNESETQQLPLTEIGADKMNSHSQSISKNGEEDSTKQNDKQQKKSFFLRIHPMAWLIIVGDAFHNFADGLAMGASIVQSLTLGVSTMFALVLHEVPHELGDYVILINSGMHWLTALGFNFLSSLTAIIGFFIGAAISANSEAANGWILSFTAGLFMYISLTDLLPELIHGGKNVAKTGWRWGLRFFLANLGFMISFAFLLTLSIYEEDLNTVLE